MSDLIKTKIRAITPLGTFESEVWEISEEEAANLRKLVRGACEGGGYFKLETSDGVEVYFSEDTVKNSVFVVLTGDGVYQ